MFLTVKQSPIVVQFPLRGLLLILTLRVTIIRRSRVSEQHRNFPRGLVATDHEPRLINILADSSRARDINDVKQLSVILGLGQHRSHIQIFPTQYHNGHDGGTRRKVESVANRSRTPEEDTTIANHQLATLP